MLDCITLLTDSNQISHVSVVMGNCIHTKATRKVFSHIYLECTSYLKLVSTIELYVKSLD